jgi:hypothetical protein
LAKAHCESTSGMVQCSSRMRDAGQPHAATIAQVALSIQW